ncbi:hypothetical protein ACX0MU_02685 [Rhizorhabdus wittichii]
MFFQEVSARVDLGERPPFRKWLDRFTPASIPMRNMSASAVGLDDLQERTINGWQPDVDHPFHEIASLALTDDPPTSSLSAREFLSLFLSADWRAAAKQVEAKYAP